MPEPSTLVGPLVGKLQNAINLFKRIVTEGKIVTVSSKTGKIKMFGINLELLQDIKKFLET